MNRDNFVKDWPSFFSRFDRLSFKVYISLEIFDMFLEWVYVENFIISMIF